MLDTSKSAIVSINDVNKARSPHSGVESPYYVSDISNNVCAFCYCSWICLCCCSPPSLLRGHMIHSPCVFARGISSSAYFLLCQHIKRVRSNKNSNYYEEKAIIHDNLTLLLLPVLQRPPPLTPSLHSTVPISASRIVFLLVAFRTLFLHPFAPTTHTSYRFISLFCHGFNS